MERKRVAPVDSALRASQSAIVSGFRPGFAQARDAVALPPLAALLEQGDPLKALEHIAFAAQHGRRAQTAML